VPLMSSALLPRAEHGKPPRLVGAVSRCEAGAAQPRQLGLDIGAAVVAHPLAGTLDLSLAGAERAAVVRPSLGVDAGQLRGGRVDLLGIDEHAAGPQHLVDLA